MKKLRTGTLLALGLVAGLLSASATPAQAADDSWSHAAIVKNGSYGYDLQICHTWSGSAADPECANGTGYYYLAPRQNSKSVWYDTDGVRVPYGYVASVTGGFGPRTLYPGWHKLSGCGRCTYTIYLQRG